MKLAWTQERITFQGKYWSTENLPVLPQPVQQPHPPVLLAANSNDTFAYAARLGLGVVCTTLTQPMPRLIPRLAEYAAAQPAHTVTPPPRVYVMVSCFVAKTRQEAHACMRENWRDSDTTAGLAYMQSLGIDPSRPDFSTGAVGWMTWDFARAKEVCIYDEPAACVERLQSLQEQLPSMSQCILECNRRGRIPSPRIQESIRLFAEQVMPKLQSVPAAS
jgi:alkanesulfonate monooxygenase SsuD/methylene tetrahydromethanopterin reductase-like flavin-dependent oxidoreductase (luciferase family)